MDLHDNQSKNQGGLVKIRLTKGKRESYTSVKINEDTITTYARKKKMAI